MASWYYKDFTGPWSARASGGASTSGVGVLVEVDGEIQAVSYLSPASGQPTPTHVGIWRVSDQALLWSVEPPTTIGAPVPSGWRDTQVLPPLQVVAGEEYRVAYAFPSNFTIMEVNHSSMPDGELGVTKPATHGGVARTFFAFPSSLDATKVYGYDVMFHTEEVPDPGGSTTNASIENALARWLSSGDDNTRQEHLPWLTHLLATAIDGAVAETKEMVEALVAIGIGVKLADAEATLAGIEAFLYSVAPDDLKEYLDGLEADVRGPGLPTIADVVDAVEALPAPSGGLPVGPVSVANGWTMRETISGTGKVKWDEPADAYILVRTGWDADRQINVYEGVTYFYDRGWWAHQQDDVIEGYGTLAAATHLLRIPTGRMSGVLIVQDDDFEFDLQAWDAPV
jgi:hypothetical protein